MTITNLEERLKRIESSLMQSAAKMLILEERLNKVGGSIDWLISLQEDDRALTINEANEVGKSLNIVLDDNGWDK